MTKTQWSKTANYPEHVKRAEKVSAQLKALASENDRIAKQVRNRYHNTGGEDLVLEKNKTRNDSLDRKFHGPYKVIYVRDTGVRIQEGRNRRWNSSAIDTTELKPDRAVTGKPPRRTPRQW